MVLTELCKLAAGKTVYVCTDLRNRPQKKKKEEWKSEQNATGVWQKGKCLCLPCTLCSMMSHLIPELTHSSKEVMCGIVSSAWLTPGFNTAAIGFVHGCMICAHYNPGQLVKVPSRCEPDYLYQ
ncbi:hypothetical protein GDO78_013841 [Eleutherodactylus coqui]|uniref:Uncharacterized protein n=1 Tax=Eleutherodactylus coqui TaxID=57060 RepID=A0A8J6B1W1_ELECQ|nr:hypothetical protein GDO78_013841 [Eleutherodactylus coqui]